MLFLKNQFVIIEFSLIVKVGGDDVDDFGDIVSPVVDIIATMTDCFNFLGRARRLQEILLVAATSRLRCLSTRMPKKLLFAPSRSCSSKHAPHLSIDL